MPEHWKISCPHCGALNRASAGRMHAGPVCGKCGQALLTDQPLELNADNFARHVDAGDWPLLVDFWAPWCAPCRAMAPVVEAAARELKHSVRVAKLNTEEASHIATRLGIRGIPCLILFQHGKIVAQRTGACDLPSLLTWVESVTGQ